MFLFKNNIEIPQPEHLVSSNTVEEFLVCNPVPQSSISEDYLKEILPSLENQMEKILENVSESEDGQDIDEEDDDEEDEEDEEDDEEDEDVLYVISIDDMPNFYEKNFDVARNKVYTMARTFNSVNNKEFKDSYIRENEICCEELYLSVVRHIDFFLFSYDHTLYTIKIHKVNNLQ